MSHTSMLLSALLMMAMVIIISPGIFAANRQNLLRNIAIWLAIFLTLGLFYQNFGPTSHHPLFQLPDTMAGTANAPEENKTPLDTSDKDSKDDGEQGYTPPKE